MSFDRDNKKQEPKESDQRSNNYGQAALASSGHPPIHYAELLKATAERRKRATQPQKETEDEQKLRSVSPIEISVSIDNERQQENKAPSKPPLEVNYSLYALDAYEYKESDLELAFNEFSVNAGNAVILYPDSEDNSAGSCKYKARVIQHGQWVRDKDQAIIEVSISALDLKNKGLLTKENTENYDELINTALEKVDAKRHYLLYVTNENESQVAVYHKLKDKAGGSVFNAVILSPDSDAYKASFIQNGVWVKDADQNIFEISIGKQDIKNKGLQTQKTTGNYAELINEALVYANLHVPEDIKHRALMKYRNKPETLAWLQHGEIKGEIKPVEEKKLHLSETDVFWTICHLARNQNEPELVKLIEAHTCIDVYQNDFTPCAYLAFENNGIVVNFLIDNFGANLNDAVYGAAAGGHKELVLNLIAKGAHVNDAVCGAAKGDHRELVEYLITQRGASLNHAVYGAAKGGHNEFVKNLLTRGANINNAVLGAGECGDIELVNELITQGASIDQAVLGAATGNHKELVYNLIDRGASLNQAVLGVALRGNVRIVNDLIAKGANKDIAVKAASRRGHKELVENLIDRGANFNEAISGAKEGGHEALIIYLINKVCAGTCPADFQPCAKLAFINNRDAINFLIDDFKHLNDAIYGAAAGGHEDLVDDLIAKGASLNEAVSGAARSGHRFLVEYLIARGASLDHAVYGAAKGDKLKLVKNLITRGANLDKAVSGAAEIGNVELVNELITQGASVDAAAMGAATGDQIELLNSLIARGACLSEAVYGAALRGDADLVNDLIRRGANKDKAVTGAARRGHKQLVDSLLAEGANVNWAVEDAAAGGHKKLLNYLIDKNAPGFPYVLAFAISGAAQVGNIDLVKKLIPRGAHLSKWTLIDMGLASAARHGHVKLVMYLLTQEPDDIGRAISSAAMNGHQQLADYLFNKYSEYRGDVIYGAACHKNMRLVEHLVNKDKFRPFSDSLWHAALGASYHLKDEKNTLLILSECQDENFRKRLLLEVKKNNFLLAFDPHIDHLLLKAKQIHSYRQNAPLSFNQALACIQPDMFGLFSFISQITHGNYLHSQSWLIIAAYLFPLIDVEAEGIRFEIKRENVLHDVNQYYSSLSKLSYFSQSATKTREFMEACKKAKSEIRLSKIINAIENETNTQEENETLYSVVAKYQSKK